MNRSMRTWMTTMGMLGLLAWAAVEWPAPGVGGVFAEDPGPAVAPTAPTIDVVGAELPLEDRAGALRLLVTCNIRGVLQWCACETGRSFLAAKRSQLLREATGGEAGASSILIDAGNAFSGDSATDVERARTMLSIMSSLGYRAALLGPDVYGLGKEFRREVREGKVPFACASLASESVAISVRMDIAARKVALIGLADAAAFASSGVQARDPVEAYGALDRAGADLVVVFGDISEDAVSALARTEGAPDIVVSCAKAPVGRLGTMGRRYMNAEKTTWVEWPEIHEVIDGTHVYWPESLPPNGYTWIDLPRNRSVAPGYGARMATGAVLDDPETLRRTRAFFDHVRGTAKEDADRYAQRTWAEHVARGGRFVGARVCKDCHEAEFAQWQTTSHYRAYSSIVEEDRWFYPLCVSCHTTGSGRPSGFTIEETPMTAFSRSRRGALPESPPLGLEGVQCEACHGPGSAHLADPAAEEAIVRVPDTGLCAECHDPRNSERFLLETERYLRAIMH